MITMEATCQVRDYVIEAVYGTKKQLSDKIVNMINLDKIPFTSTFCANTSHEKIIITMTKVTNL